MTSTEELNKSPFIRIEPVLENHNRFCCKYCARQGFKEGFEEGKKYARK